MNELKGLRKEALLGSILIASSIVLLALSQRFEVIQFSDGMALRLDRLTGKTALCVMQRDSSELLIAPCDGKFRH
jgi:hypothetical protein